MTQPRQKLRPPKDAASLLDLYYLEMRCHLLETAAALDRIERAEGGEAAFKDKRVACLFEALDHLKTPGGDRAERFLNLLSEE